MKEAMTMQEIDKQLKAAEQEWLEGWKVGPQRTRWTRLPLQVEDPAPNYELRDSRGDLFKLNESWKDKPALILFWRHYGCGCGMERAARLQKEYPDYLDAGANVVIIGQGEPERATAYAEKYNFPPVPVLCDPDYQVYQTYGLVEGKESQILFDAPDVFQDRDLNVGLELAKSRKEDGRPLVDNSWILPGEFVVNSKGIVVLAYRYNYCEDFPDHRVLLAAIREGRKSA
jgi:peroxiredoxin